MLRIGKEPEEHVGIGYDASGRLLEIVAIRNDQGDWLIKHAQTPPQERIKRELGFGRRLSIGDTTFRERIILLTP